jgi:hypothetical protein
MVDIESADATSAPVTSVRFKLASSFVEQKRRTTRAIIGSRRLHVFPDVKKAQRLAFVNEVPRQLPKYPDDRNQPASPRLNCMLNDVEKNVMKALLGLGRNDVIRVVALLAIVVFPLIADAQLGRSSGAVKTSQDVSPVAAAPARTAAVKPDSCADQHWPFLSAGCLRGSTQPVEPRLVSMNAETSAKSATPGDAPKAARTSDIARDNGPSVGSKKPAKPRIAAHRREQRTPNVSYAANLDAGHMSMPGW